jgi:hypothetical protein
MAYFIEESRARGASEKFRSYAENKFGAHNMILIFDSL